jgi:hypothetical protein
MEDARNSNLAENSPNFGNIARADARFVKEIQSHESNVSHLPWKFRMLPVIRLDAKSFCAIQAVIVEKFKKSGVHARSDAMQAGMRMSNAKAQTNRFGRLAGIPRILVHSRKHSRIAGIQRYYAM